MENDNPPLPPSNLFSNAARVWRCNPSMHDNNDNDYYTLQVYEPNIPGEPKMFGAPAKTISVYCENAVGLVYLVVSIMNDAYNNK